MGDAPDDWYLLYRDPGDATLRAMAYIVTYGKSKEEAGKEPHAIRYDSYVDVDGVKLSDKWSFWNWSEEEGIHGDKIGEAILSNFAFVEPGPDAFTKPAGAMAAPFPER